jgi:tRNA-specific 2-thiouridylase
MRFKSKIVPEEVLSLASNKKYILRNGEGREASRAHYFTIGQRKGLNVGGNKDPLFIIATNVETNTIYTGLSSHPGLFRKGLFIEKSEVHWIRNDMTLGNGEQMEVMARIRYRQIASSYFASI